MLFRVGDAVASRSIHAAIYDALRLCKAFRNADGRGLATCNPTQPLATAGWDPAAGKRLDRGHVVESVGEHRPQRSHPARFVPLLSSPGEDSRNMTVAAARCGTPARSLIIAASGIAGSDA